MPSGEGKPAVSVGGVPPWDQAATAQIALATVLSQHPLSGADSFITGQWHINLEGKRG